MSKMELLIDPEMVPRAICELARIPDVRVQIPTRDLRTPDPNEEHPSYALPLQQLVPLVISITGLATGLISLATVLLKVASERQQMRQAKSSLPEPPRGQDAIRINNQVIVLASFANPDDLALFLRNALRDDRTGEDSPPDDQLPR